MSWYLMMNCGLERIVGYYSKIDGRDKTSGHRYNLTFFERSFLRSELNEAMNEWPLIAKARLYNLVCRGGNFCFLWIAQLFFDGKGHEINGIKIGYVIFSDLKITIRSCLEAVVLIEADNQ